MILTVEETTNVGKSCRVGHVNGDGMAVTQGRVRDKLMEGRPSVAWVSFVISQGCVLYPRVAISDDSVQHDLMQVGSLKPQHLINAGTADLVGRLPDLFGGLVKTAESGAD